MSYSSTILKLQTRAVNRGTYLLGPVSFNYNSKEKISPILCVGVSIAYIRYTGARDKFN